MPAINKRTWFRNVDLYTLLSYLLSSDVVVIFKGPCLVILLLNSALTSRIDNIYSEFLLLHTPRINKIIFFFRFHGTPAYISIFRSNNKLLAESKQAFAKLFFPRLKERSRAKSRKCGRIYAALKKRRDSEAREKRYRDRTSHSPRAQSGSVDFGREPGRLGGRTDGNIGRENNSAERGFLAYSTRLAALYVVACSCCNFPADRAVFLPFFPALAKNQRPRAGYYISLVSFRAIYFSRRV